MPLPEIPSDPEARQQWINAQIIRAAEDMTATNTRLRPPLDPPTQEMPFVPQAAPTVSGTEANQPERGRHRLPENINPRRRMLTAAAAGCIATGSAMLYSQYSNLPEVWGKINDFVQQLW